MTAPKKTAAKTTKTPRKPAGDAAPVDRDEGAPKSPRAPRKPQGRAQARRATMSANAAARLGELRKVVTDPDVPDTVIAPGLAKKKLDAETSIEAAADPEQRTTADDAAIAMIDAAVAAESGEWVGAAFMGLIADPENPDQVTTCIDGPWTWVGLVIVQTPKRAFCSAVENDFTACARITGHDGAHVRADAHMVEDVLVGPLSTASEVE